MLFDSHGNVSYAPEYYDEIEENDDYYDEFDEDAHKY